MVTEMAQEYRAMLGPLLIKYRDDLGLKNSELAELLGIPVSKGRGSAVDNFVRRDAQASDPHLSMVFVMCEKLGPSFADDLADLFFDAARRGIIARRDEALKEAGRLTRLVKEARRKPMPPMPEAANG